jgi:hypothetical protein
LIIQLFKAPGHSTYSLQSPAIMQAPPSMLLQTLSLPALYWCQSRSQYQTRVSLTNPTRNDCGRLAGILSVCSVSENRQWDAIANGIIRMAESRDVGVQGTGESFTLYTRARQSL